MSKKLLWTGFLTTSLIGIGFLIGMFGGALNPPANAGEKLPRINVSTLKPGEILTHDAGYESRWDFRYIVYKNYDSEITVFGVPLRDGLVDMPDLKWWRWGPTCKDFGPSMSNGKVVPNSQFKCHDSELNEWFAKENVWDINGNNLGTSTEDMEKIKFKIKGRDLVPHM